MSEAIHEIKTFLNQEFTLLNDVASKWFLIIFCAVFATIFLIVYNPMNVDDYIINTRIGTLISIKSAGIIGALALIITQFVIRPILRLNSFTLAQFLLWVIAEFTFVSIVAFIFYGERGLPFFPEFTVTLQKTYTISILPYSLALLIIALYKTYRANRRLSKTKPTPSIKYLTIRDATGKDALVLKPIDLIYLKSEDNYVLVTYLRNDAVEKKLVRNTLKTIDAQLKHPDIMQIHRSYLINLQNVNKVIARSSKIDIQMNHISEGLLPVSTTYKESLQVAVAAYSS